MKDDQPGATAAVATAAQKLVSQLNHRVKMDSSELADLSTAQPDAQEMLTLAKIGSWIEAMSFEASKILERTSMYSHAWSDFKVAWQEGTEACRRRRATSSWTREPHFPLWGKGACKCREEWQGRE